MAQADDATKPEGDELDPSRVGTILTSFPRSGNTLIRTYIEQITKIYTGSDCDLKRALNCQLQELGMYGESIINFDKKLKL